MDRLVRIMTGERKLLLLDCGFEIARFNIATSRYETTPKYWSNDYRNALGSYKVAGIFRKGSVELEKHNAHHVPWYLSPKARDPFEDAGTGVYGEGLIILDYPNKEDLYRYNNARNNGLLKIVWSNFCVDHLKPIYKLISEHNNVPFENTIVKTDYGERTYPELLSSCPILDERIAFELGVAIHGTNDPDCIGSGISAGCIRMHNSDILALMAKIEVGVDVEFHSPEFFSM
jgi:hypothetical protein